MIGNDTFKDLTVSIKKKVQELPNLTVLNDEELYQQIDNFLYEIISELTERNPIEYAYLSELTFRDKNSIRSSVYESIRGLDVLGTIIADKSITEVMINGYDNIFVERAGKVEKLETRFESTEVLQDIIIKFVRMAGRSVDESDPIVDTRLETMVLSGSPGLPLEAIRQQIASAVDIIIHLSRLRDFSRKTMAITEVDRLENGVIKLNTLFKFEETEGTSLTKVVGRLKRTENKMIHDEKFINAGIYNYLD